MTVSQLSIGQYYGTLFTKSFRIIISHHQLPCQRGIDTTRTTDCRTEREGEDIAQQELWVTASTDWHGGQDRGHPERTEVKHGPGELGTDALVHRALIYHMYNFVTLAPRDVWGYCIWLCLSFCMSVCLSLCVCPRTYRFEVWAFSFSPQRPSSIQLYTWVPAYRKWWKCECLVIAHTFCMARMIPGEVGVGMNRSARAATCKALWAVQRTGHCTALYTELQWWL